MAKGKFKYPADARQEIARPKEGSSGSGYNKTFVTKSTGPNYKNGPGDTGEATSGGGFIGSSKTPSSSANEEDLKSGKAGGSSGSSYESRDDGFTKPFPKTPLGEAIEHLKGH